MHWLLLAVFLAALLFGPQLWARAVFRRHAVERDDFPGSGGELARHLLDRFGLEQVRVETTAQGDHYDPTALAVRLLPAHHDGHSLTAITIAAHEVGHALQHARGEAMLAWRHRLVQVALLAERIGAVALFALPVLALLTRAPALGLLAPAALVVSVGIATLVHLLTLPVELDASFGKALPLLEQGYLKPEDLPAARRILRAAAFTYVAASLAAVLNLGRWWRLARG